MSEEKTCDKDLLDNEDASEGKIHIDSVPHASPGNGEADQAGPFFMPMKRPMSYCEQIEHLKASGLAIEDEGGAIDFFSQINYYRLRGYWLTLERNGMFGPDTTFSAVCEIYSLDSELRRWLWNAIEPVELKMRASFAHHTSQALGPRGYENPCYYRKKSAHSSSMKSCAREIDRALKDGVPCVRHNMEKYGALPVWAAVEIMTLGTLSKLYGNLNSKVKDEFGCSVKSAIASDFGVRAHYLQSWIQHLTYVRNLCGHHNRVYNRVMTTTATLLKEDYGYEGPKQFPTFLILRQIYLRSWPGRWLIMLDELTKIIEAHSTVDLKPMGFPGSWRGLLSLERDSCRRCESPSE